MLAINTNSIEITRMDTQLHIRYNFEQLLALSEQLTGEVCIDTIRAELALQNGNLSATEINNIIVALEEYISEYL